jgi:hypothetical protein
MNPNQSPNSESPNRRGKHANTFFIWGFVFGFLLLLMAGPHNGVIKKCPPESRTTLQQWIVALFSVIDDGYEGVTIFVDLKFTVIQIGVPLVLWVIAATLYLKEVKLFQNQN